MIDHRKKDIIELTRCTLADYRRMEKLPLTVMADNVRSMYNVGALLRTADAFLVKEVVMGGITGVPPHPEITKTALGAEESVEWRHVDDTLAETVRMKNEGWRVCVLEQAHDSIPLQDFRAVEGEKYLLVVGNEVKGVDQRIVDIADHILEIPQHGTKHSLNVSVSAGIALWQFYLSFIADMARHVPTT